ncbi:hypothetical protein ABTX34_28365 [Streptomyces sp. NPDC096538]|uniref:hypothetical protein n=1 Tax=Streptomyces sp. NPDC096538 TaxID=3155427 RepID=UPI00331C3E1F
MPDTPRHTQDTWLPGTPGSGPAPDAPHSGSAAADPGYEATTLHGKTDAAGAARGADIAHRAGGTRTGTPGSGTHGTDAIASARTSAPGSTDRTSVPGSTDRTSVPGPDGTGAHTTGTHTTTPGPDGTGAHTTGVHATTPGREGTGVHATTPDHDGAGARAAGLHKGGTPHGNSPHTGPDGRLLPTDTCDRLSEQLRQAVAGFVDRPRDAVEEADLVLHELTERLTDALTERRRTLTQNWKAPAQGEPKDGAAPAADTEQLRLALRDYRELAERLMGV